MAILSDPFWGGEGGPRLYSSFLPKYFRCTFLTEGEGVHRVLNRVQRDFSKLLGALGRWSN